MPMRWCSGGRGHGWTIESLRSITGEGWSWDPLQRSKSGLKVATPATPRPGGGWSWDLFHCNGSTLVATPTTPICSKQGKQKRERGGMGRRAGNGSRRGRYEKPLVRCLGVAGVARLLNPFQRSRFADQGGGGLGVAGGWPGVVPHR